jgi:hypothetical protein
MKRIFALSVFCVGFLVLGATAPAQDATQLSKDSAKQTPAPELEPGPGPTSSRPDTTGSLGSTRGKSAKQQVKDCVNRTRARDNEVSEADARKACRQSMKVQKANSEQPEK